MPLRDATPDDAVEIYALIGELADYEKLRHEMTATVADIRGTLFPAHGPPAARVTMADTAEGETAGFALWFPTYSTFLGRAGIWLEDLYVRPHLRARGFGKALLEDLRDRTDGRVEWYVLDWNTPSIEFYERLGARPVTGWTTYRWTT